MLPDSNVSWTDIIAEIKKGCPRRAAYYFLNLKFVHSGKTCQSLFIYRIPTL